VQVPSDITLARMHRIIQVAMGWHNSHLHQFVVGETRYGVPEFDEFSELDLKDERKARLNQVLSKAKQKVVYEYDFGDGWEHDVLLEIALQPDPGLRYPRCSDGARACPPEDCGGAAGYENLLQAISDADHEEHDEWIEWIGGEFNPEKFDMKEVDTALRRIR
jgi:hypothetical protein